MSITLNMWETNFNSTKNKPNVKTESEQLRTAMIRRILEGDGKASPDQRHAAFNNAGLPKPLGILIDKVAKDSYKVTDEDITAVKESGLSEDQIFELIICAAFGQATRQYDAGIEALEAAIKNERDTQKG
jgi:hypothetical protein